MELSLIQKIEVLECVLKKLERRSGLEYVCFNILFAVERVTDIVTSSYNSHFALGYIPELLEFKPDGKMKGESWWPDGDWDSRISVVETILQNLRNKQANGTN